MDHKLKYTKENYKTLEEINKGGKHSGCRAKQRITRFDNRSINYKKKIRSEKHPAKRMKRQATGWEKISVGHLFYRGPLPRICKEPSKG